MPAIWAAAAAATSPAGNAAGASPAFGGREVDRLLPCLLCPSRPKGAESRRERSRLAARRADLGVIRGVPPVLGVPQGELLKSSFAKQGMLVRNMACW